MYEAVDIIELDKELAGRGLRHFIPLVWHLIEPVRPFVPNWNIDAMCEHLDATITGDIRRLVMNVPPGTMKSLTACVFYPAYLWTKRQEYRSIFGSFSDALSKRDSIKTRDVVDSEFYQERWNVELKKGTGFGVERFGTVAGGFRKYTTIGGTVTGEHADVQVADDPLKPLDLAMSLIVSKNALEKAISWWGGTMASRLVDLQKSVRIIIMQRLAVNDLAGAVLKEQGYEHLMLPMEYEPKRKCFTSIGFEDPRTEPGELLWSKRFPKEELVTMKKELGAREYRAQYQQDPVLTGGNIFKRKHAQYYTELPKRFEKMVQSWDCTFKGSDTSDFVVGQVWGLKDANFYLIDQIRDRLTFSETCKAVERLTAKHPKAIKKYVEDKANGSAVMDYLKKKIAGFEAINPEGGKVARANAVEPLWSGGNVWLPNKDKAPWIDNFLTELEQFDSGPHDDQVDAMTQALIKLYRRNIDRLRRAMAAV